VDIFVQQYLDLEIMREHLGEVLAGFWVTIQLSVVSAVTSLTWGLLLALLRSTRSRALVAVRAVVVAYIDVFRGVPLLLVVLLLSGSLPFLTVLPRFIRQPDFLGFPDIFWYGVMAITITYGAYLAEVYRAGLEAVPIGQSEAASSLGMSRAETLRHILVPQAVRTVVPPLLNDMASLMKDTSLVQVIGLTEVVRAGREVQGETFNSSALTLGAILFLLVTIPIARLVDREIRKGQLRFSRGLA
jgi:polar amino acid transport system permease protein